MLLKCCVVVFWHRVVDFILALSQKCEQLLKPSSSQCLGGGGGGGGGGELSPDVRSIKTVNMFRKKIRKCDIILLIDDGCKDCSLCSSQLFYTALIILKSLFLYIFSIY